MGDLLAAKSAVVEGNDGELLPGIWLASDWPSVDDPSEAVTA